MSDENTVDPLKDQPVAPEAAPEAGPEQMVGPGTSASDAGDGPAPAASAKPAKKRTSSTRRKSTGSTKPKAKTKATTPEPATAAAVPSAEEGPAEAAAVVVGEQPMQEGVVSGAPAHSDEPQISPLVTQWLSRPLSPTAQERLERMRRTVPGYQRPSRPAMTAMRALSWLLFMALATAFVTTLVGALDRTMETTLVGGAPAAQASQIIPAQEGQKVRVVNAAGVNLRSQPRQGVTFVMVRLKKGTTLTLLASKPGDAAWFKVKAPTGESGWVVDDKTYTQLVDAP
jgi:hypothetical protein